MLPKDFGGGLSTQAVVVILDGCLGRRKIPKGCRLDGLQVRVVIYDYCPCENSVGAACSIVVVVGCGAYVV